MNLNTVVSANELELGDVVRLYDGAYGYATVRQVNRKEKSVTLFRPYVKSEDFSYTGGVICYVGIEEFEAWGDFTLIERKGPLK